MSITKTLKVTTLGTDTGLFIIRAQSDAFDTPIYSSLVTRAQLFAGIQVTYPNNTARISIDGGYLPNQSRTGLCTESTLKSVLIPFKTTPANYKTCGEAQAAAAAITTEAGWKIRYHDVAQGFLPRTDVNDIKVNDRIYDDNLGYVPCDLFATNPPAGSGVYYTYFGLSDGRCLTVGRYGNSPTGTIVCIGIGN
jgi:hypothetical protein